MIFRPAGLLLATLAATPVLAQQFQQTTLPPGPVVWTEAVEAFDANGDGKIDVLFGNGIGFSNAGGALLPTLLINTSPGPGTITFADETAARLPAGFTLQNKGLVVFDVDNDGDRDVVFANAFASQPTLLVNNGAGVFTNETASRLPAITLNSFGGGFGDVDNDGDLDLVLVDAGASAFGGVGGPARLFLNNGAGVFALAPATQLNAANKIGAQNAQLLDVDNDFDLDVIVDGKSSNQQLYLNDGAGTFTLQPATLLPVGGGNTYATDFSDLDNDNDLDGVYISIAPGSFNEGTAQNTLTRSSTLGFIGSQATMTTPPTGQDDNDVVFVDANDDGLQDFVVGSLANNREKLYVNAGTFATGSFVFDTNGFSAQTDSTLDLAVGDFDQDGRYDVVTGQGESGSFQEPRLPQHWCRRYSRAAHRARGGGGRAGAAVAHPGRRLRAARVGAGRDLQARPAVCERAARHHRRQGTGDAVVQHAHALRWRRPAPGTGGADARPGGRVGMDVTYRVHAVDPSANASDSAPVTFRICGAEGYGTALPNSTGRRRRSWASTTPAWASTPSRCASPACRRDARASSSSAAPRTRPARPSTRASSTSAAASAAPAPSSRTGAVWRRWRSTCDADPFAGVALAGQPLYFELQYQDPNALTLNLTNALEVVFCDCDTVTVRPC